MPSREPSRKTFAVASRIYGIRHHSPRCARLLLQALEADPPDAILLEAPVEVESVMEWVLHEGLHPPIAVLVYEKEDPSAAVYYPLVEYSPEWQTLRFAARHGIPVHMMDLPLAYRQAPKALADPGPVEGEEPGPQLEFDLSSPDPAPIEDGIDEDSRQELRDDPLGAVARIEGYEDPEAWWEATFEFQRDTDDPSAAEDVFAMITEMMAALRETDFTAESLAGWNRAQNEKLRNLRREAHMRKTLRSVLRKGAANPAIICGAWHVPSLEARVPAKMDNSLLSGLKKTKMEATWAPWTYRNLATSEGYSAGVKSPAYYEHLWRYPQAPAVPWLSRASRLLRGRDVPAGAAQAVDASRMAAQLAALRGQQVAGLEELQEAALSVLAEGRENRLEPVRDLLIIGDRIGSVPPEIPATPLQRDFRNTCRSLLLKPSQEPVEKDFDLRTPKGLPRSRFLHRLILLGVPWGRLSAEKKRDMGSFHERWQLVWRPEYEVTLIKAGRWGATILAAATARARDEAGNAENLAEIVILLRAVLNADLPEAFEPVLQRLETVAAVQSEFGALLEAIPPLAEVAAYGDVRQTRQWRVRQILEHTVARAMAGMETGCRNLEEEFAREITRKLVQATFALRSGDWPELRRNWLEDLRGLLEDPQVAWYLQGRLTRLLLQQQTLTNSDARRRLSQALSPGIDPQQASLWLEGFLQGSGLILLHSNEFWEILDRWLAGLPRDVFTENLPLLRKAFSTLNRGEKRRLAEKARVGRHAEHRIAHDAEDAVATAASAGPVDWQRALRPLPILRQILPGLEK